MLWSNRRDNNVDSRLKYSLGWPVLKGMRFHMPFNRSLQHSDRLRHVESTVLLIECVFMLFVKMYSATSLSGKWVVGGKKRRRSERKAITWDFFLALIISFRESDWLKSRKSFTARSFYQTACHSNVSSGAYNLVLHTRRCVVRGSDLEVGTMRRLSRSRWQANLGKEQDEKVFSSL